MIMPPERAVNSDEQASRRDNARVCKVSGVVHSPGYCLPPLRLQSRTGTAVCMPFRPQADRYLSRRPTDTGAVATPPFRRTSANASTMQPAPHAGSLRVMKGLSRNSASVSPSCMAAIILATSQGVLWALKFVRFRLKLFQRNHCQR